MQGTGFFNRTAYLFLREHLPACFLELDVHLAQALAAVMDRVRHPSVVLAENLCRRMADVDWYSEAIHEALGEKHVFKAAIVTGTLLVGHLSCCKSVFDAGAICLSELYSLGLKPKSQDLSKGDFWRVLREKQPAVGVRYMAFKKTVDNLVCWRDAAVHRNSPLVIVHSPSEPQNTAREQQTVMMVDRPNAGVEDLIRKPKSVPWVSPLDFVESWRPRLVEFCNEVCKDVASWTPAT